MHIASPSECRVLPAQVQQAADMHKDLLLIRGSASRGERIATVAGKPAGEITAIVRIIASRHADLVARVNLRNAAHGQENCERKIQSLRRCSPLSHKHSLFLAPYASHL